MIKWHVWYIDNSFGIKARWHPDFDPTTDINKAFRFREFKQTNYPTNEYEVREFK